MLMYPICKRIILSGQYDETDMKKKLDMFLLKDRITLEQYEELIDLINKK